MVILHLSDLHFGWTGSEAPETNRHLALDGLLRRLAKIKQKEPEWKPDCLCLTGDLGWNGSEDNYKSAGQWLEKLIEQNDLDLDNVYLCPGNHDSNRDLATQNARPGDPKEADKVLRGYKIPEHFQKPFEHFSSFCRDFGLSAYKMGKLDSYVCGVRSLKSGHVVCLNTAWFCKDDEDKGKLWLGLPLIRQMEFDGALPHPDDLLEKPTLIALMHHPSECLHEAETNACDNRPNTFDYLCSRTHFLLTGHTHGEVRRANQCAETTWHLTGGAAFAGASHFNSFRLIRIEETIFQYRSYEFDPRGIDYGWGLKRKSDPLTYRRQHSIFEPRRRKVKPTGTSLDLTLETRKVKREDPPSFWLQAQSRFIPIIGRDKELETLAKWRDRETVFSWMVVTGGEGSGKTRLAQEFGLTCQDDLKWKAGFLDEEALEKIVLHNDIKQWSLPSPTLIMVDYAGAKIKVLLKFIKLCLKWAASDSKPGPRPNLRLLLLERQANPGEGWLYDLVEEMSGVWREDLRRSMAPIMDLGLPGAKDGKISAVMSSIVQKTFESLSRLKEKPAPVFIEPDEESWRLMNRNTGGRPLYMQMAAIQAFESGRLDSLFNLRQEELLQEAVKREKRYIKHLCPKKEDGGGLKVLAERTIALLCLISPWPDDDTKWLGIIEAEAKACGFPRIQPGDVVKYLHLSRAPQMEGQDNLNILSPIQPDILASAYLINVLNQRPNIRQETLIRILDLAGIKAWENLLRARKDVYCLEGFNLDDWVPKIIPSRSDDELSALDGLFSKGSPAWAYWEVKLYQVLLDRIEGCDNNQEKQSRFFHNLGRAWGTLGGKREALKATQQAVEIREGLARERPDKFEPELAKSLNNLGIFYSALGLKSEALEASKRAVEIREKLAKERPDEFEPNLAKSLNNIGTDYSSLGLKEEALEAAKRAVEIYKRLTKERPDTFEADLALSLNNLGTHYSHLGRRKKALKTAKQVVEIYQRLAKERPDAYEPDLAMSLNNLGLYYSKMSPRDKAVQETTQAVNIYQRLAKERPDIYEPELANALDTLGIVLQAAEKHMEAMEALKSALDLLAPHFFKLPKAHSDLMCDIIRRYNDSCQNAGIKPDMELLEPIKSKLSS